MKYLYLFLSTLASLSIVAGKDFTPESSCNFFKQARCAASLVKLVSDINSLPIPPTIEHVQAVLINGHSFVTECKDCIYDNQIDLICETIDYFVTQAGDALGIDVDFDVDTCKSERFVAAVSDLIDGYIPLKSSENSGKPVTPSSINEDELLQLDKVYDTLYKDITNPPSKEEIFGIIEVMASRPEVDMPVADFSIMATPCEVEVVIDSIALGLSAIGLRGGSGRKIARKMYDKVPKAAQDKLIRTAKSITTSNFGDKIYEMLKIIYENLTWNALKDSFSELGFWDAATFALSFAAIFASGGTAFLINIGLLSYDAAMLVSSINKCFF